MFSTVFSFLVEKTLSLHSISIPPVCKQGKEETSFCDKIRELPFDKKAKTEYTILIYWYEKDQVECLKPLPQKGRKKGAKS